MTPPARPFPTPMLLAGLLALSCAAHWLAFPLITADVTAYYVPWLDDMVAQGRLAWFAHPTGNYAPPYFYLLGLASLFHGVAPDPYLVKAIGVAGTAWLAFALFRLGVALRLSAPAQLGALVFALPSVVVNAALLGQCDALWAAPLVLATACALRRRHLPMLLWCGVAAAFKLQAGLAAPFFLAVLLSRRVPVWQWLAAPAALGAMLLPALALGWPLADMLAIYPRQSATFHDLARNAPNLWMIVQQSGLADPAPLIPLAYLVAGGAVGAYLLAFLRRRPEGSALLLAALLGTLLTAGLLPKMHERYFFLTDVLALAFAVAVRDRGGWRVFALVQTGSTLALFAYLSGIAACAILGAGCMIAATWIAAKRFLALPATAPSLRTAIPFWNAAA